MITIDSARLPAAARPTTAPISARLRAAVAAGLLAAGLIAVPASAGGHSPGAPARLTVDDLSRPLTVEGAPRFGWQPRDRDPGEIQTAFQLRVRDARGATVWDSGRVRSADQAHDGPALPEGAAWTWTVRTWDRTGRVSPWARPAGFETGIGDDGWEGAAWIRRTTGVADDWSLLRDETPLTGDAATVVRARAYVAGSHTWELWVNGTRAGRGSSFGYPGEGFYQAADVTSAVRHSATLTLGALLHWYGPGQGRAAGAPGLLVTVVVEYADGTRQAVVSDASWRTAEGPYRQGALRNGEGDRIEHADGLRAQAVRGWQQAGFDDAAWSPVAVAGTHPTAPFTHLSALDALVSEVMVPAKRILTAADGTPVADFGVVIPARPVVDFDQGVAGRTLTLRASYELAADGRVSTTGRATQSTTMTYPYTQAGGAQTFAAFTHLAFRYLEIPGAGEDITPADVRAVLVHTATEGPAARFDSDDATLDGVWELMQRSALYSVQEQFVDTPTREKGQFLADAANISYATMQGFGERAATRKAIREFLASNRRYWATDTGRYNAVYPNGDGKRDIPDFSELFPNWVWRYYQVTGDRGLLAEAYPAIRDTSRYIVNHIPAGGPTAGLVTNLSGGSGPYLHGIVDWPAPGRFGYDMTTAARTTVNALGVDVLRRTADIAGVLGRPAGEVDALRASQRDLTTAINQRLRRADGAYVDGLLADGTPSAAAGQHASAYPMALGIAPEGDLPALAERIAGMGMRQGPMTAHWLLSALAEAGRPDAVLALLTDHDDLGWARILDQGGTFTWEAWDPEPGDYSQSHGWGAQSAVDVIETLLGIRPGAVLKPPASGLDRASGSVPTQRGEIGLSWQRVGGGVRGEATIPVNVTARLELPVVDGHRYRVTGAVRSLGVDGDVAVFEAGSGTVRFGPVHQ
ncbi:family 78 glycoside hydrolase catalytic domain [Actinoplanes sp. NBRC 101535]|uniref:family 78 glycoside hydrolase catalytic domain n=1 Tax=Actinoplanes sp. NBRC 101535 TaxID=3032196 RepID=UPI0024A1D44E|nr:family 78 glycoside hydrolase catalytic domain [Actinoplanes sp. NBRC 101535]GLY00449.1 alpha-L-rhamnosidase [Actinoplanes sp. NBRC 101535]